MNRHVVAAVAAMQVAIAGLAVAQEATPEKASVILPLGRTAYFVGETVPLGVNAPAAVAEVKIEAVSAAGRVLLYQGKPGPLWLEAARLAPGDYAIEVNGQPVVPRLTVVSTLRRSVASMQDESSLPGPNYGQERDPAKQREIAVTHEAALIETLHDSGLTALFPMGSIDVGQDSSLDTLARFGMLSLPNPDTRPTSFCPTRNVPEELDSMSQRLILGAQANGRYPNFGGFCYGWDTTGFAVGGRKMLLVYWGWADKTQALRNYIDRIDKGMCDEFTRRSGLQPVSESEYLAYLLSIQRPEFGTAIDIPTRVWLEEIVQYAKPMADADRAAFEKRLDMWSAFLMDQYNEVYSVFSRNLASVDPSFHNTASVQVDHCAVRNGQYFPSAYSPLDLRYQSTWNDQIGGPDYAYQWLLTQALLSMHRTDQPVWISNAMAWAHHRAEYPGKMVRVAAHGLSHGATGIGFALEGFSNLLGGMNAESNWQAIKGKSGGADVRSGKEFLDRFAALAVAGRGDFGVGILFSKSQLQRQHLAMGYGTPQYKALVALTRLGYTPRFVTEEDFAADRVKDVRALVVLGQTFEVPSEVAAGIERFAAAGGRVLVDGNTSVKLPKAEPLGLTIAFSQDGKPHNWASPNMVGVDNDTLMYARWHAELAPPFAKALGDTGRGIFASAAGAQGNISLTQLRGGQATYVVAVNDSYVQTQADWHQVRERLALTPHAPAGAVLYDCTEEKALGPLAALECDLSATTARVYAVLPVPVATVALRATQKVDAGTDLTLSVQFLDKARKPLAAAIPFHLAVRRPDGAVWQEFYRATDERGDFAMTVPLPVNLPDGKWSVTARSQLDGMTTTLPVTVKAAKAKPLATPAADSTVLRGAGAVTAVLAKGQKVVLPVFDSPAAESLIPVAEKVREVLKGRGVEVEIRRSPALATYTLAYELDEAKAAENARVDRGEAFGTIRRETVNANDWYAALSGWRFGLPVILLDRVGVDDCPPAETLAARGMLWPAATAAFPGPGRAVIHGVDWAFAPRVDAIVIQAADIEGLLAGAQALGKLPEDRLTASVQTARTELWRQFAVGGAPAVPKANGLTAKGAESGQAPVPFAIAFPDARPPTPDQVQRPVRQPVAATPVPAAFAPGQYVLYYQSHGAWVETATAGMLVPDLRFSQGVAVVADVKTAGKVRIVAQGVFRYSDRKPCSQAQWEDLLALRDQLVPKERKPMEFEVLIGGELAGKLLPTKTAECKVMTRTTPVPQEFATEEAVTELAGEVDLPAGRQEIMLAKRNVVDGTLECIAVGMDPPPPAAEKKWRRRRRAR